jgi:hypothetical protein
MIKSITGPWPTFPGAAGRALVGRAAALMSLRAASALVGFRRARWSLSRVGVDTLGVHEDGGAPLGEHHAVIGVEVLVRAARRGEDLA